MFTSRSQRIVSLITVSHKVLAVGIHAKGALVTVKQLGLHMGCAPSCCATTCCFGVQLFLRRDHLHFSRKTAFGSDITSHEFYVGKGLHCTCIPLLVFLLQHCHSLQGCARAHLQFGCLELESSVFCLFCTRLLFSSFRRHWYNVELYQMQPAQVLPNLHQVAPQIHW